MRRPWTSVGSAAATELHRRATRPTTRGWSSVARARGYSPRVPKRDVALYSPPTSNLFRRSVGRTGGAERQMAILAGELVRRGRDVAIVVYPVPDPSDAIDHRLTLVERAPHAGGKTSGMLLEGTRVMRALRRANARVVVVRGGRSVLGVVAVYCWLQQRKLVFSSANDFDFLDRPDLTGTKKRFYTFGVKRAAAIVVQSERQVELARRAFPQAPARIVRIPSFASRVSEEANGRPTDFFWVGRLIDYKRPLLYAELAAAVPDARFVLIPHVPLTLTAEQSGLLAQLEAAAAGIPNLVVESPLPHAALMERLGRAVAVVNTSLYEGMPNTFLEAWSLGVPVLTLSFDPDEIVSEHRLGVAAGDSWEKFVAGARALWEGRFERDELAKRLRAYVHRTHSSDAVGLQWDALFESLGAYPAESRDRDRDRRPLTKR
jgi:glycosyltransferase involved in cell wall biosynthesis